MHDIVKAIIHELLETAAPIEQVINHMNAAVAMAA